MPDNPNNRPLPNPNLGTDQDTADWIAANVYPNGWTVDGKTMEIIDPDTGEIKGRVPTLYPRT
jgi:hypothetical protein